MHRLFAVALILALTGPGFAGTRLVTEDTGHLWKAYVITHSGSYRYVLVRAFLRSTARAELEQDFHAIVWLRKIKD
jgi:hypothetical protein